MMMIMWVQWGRSSMHRTFYHRSIVFLLLCSRRPHTGDVVHIRESNPQSPESLHPLPSPHRPVRDFHEYFPIVTKSWFIEFYHIIKQTKIMENCVTHTNWSYLRLSVCVAGYRSLVPIHFPIQLDSGTSSALRPNHNTQKFSHFSNEWK